MFDSRPPAREAALLNRFTTPSALLTPAGRAAPGAVPASTPPIVIIGITEGDADCSALAIEMMLLPLSEMTDVGFCVCVSLLPHWNAVTCLDAGRSLNGVSGPTVSGLSVPETSIDSPGRCHAKFGSAAAAMSLCGQSSWNHAAPPLPAMMCTERAVGLAEAAIATSLPAVLSRIFERDTPRAAPAATLHLMRARRVISRCSSRLEKGDFAMVGLLTRRCRPRPAWPRRQGACRRQRSRRSTRLGCSSPGDGSSPARR